VADQKYTVEIEYQISQQIGRQLPALSGQVAGIERGFMGSQQAMGGLNSGMRQGHSQAGALASAFADLGGSMRDAFTGAVEKAGALAMGLGKLGAVAGVGLAAYGVGHLNNELEQTQLSLGAIFNAQGFSHDFHEGLRMGGEQLAKMKQDVKTLPGDLGELAGIMKTIATPAAQGGLGPDAIRKMAGQSMLVGGIMGLGPEIVAREMAGLMTGRAGSHNILGTRLGFVGAKAKKLNAEDPAQRAKDINAEMAKYGPAAEEFGKSFVAQFTTLKDNVKYTLLAPATSPLFNSVKKTIGDINDWFDHNAAKVSIFAGRLGDGLAHAWERGTKIVEEWLPAIERFAEDAYSRLSDIWAKLAPDIKALGSTIKDSLMNGAALDKIESILKLYATIKIGGAVGGAVSPLIGPGVNMFTSAFGKGGGAMGGASAGGLGAIGAVGGGLAIGGALAAGGIAKGEMSALENLDSQYHEQAVKNVGDFAREMSQFSALFNSTINPAIEHFGTNGMHYLNTTIEAFNDLSDPMSLAIAELERFGPSIGIAGSSLQNLVNWMRGPQLGKTEDLIIERSSDALDSIQRPKMHDEHGRTPQDLVKAGAGGGGGGVHIHGNVEITISQNNEPSRVARNVVDMLAQMRRHPTVSRNVPNYSAISGGGR
jgi:hypothetical protein